jgi:hypothetical protein
MKILRPVVLVLALAAGLGWIRLAESDPGADMTTAAKAFVETLTDAQRAKTLLAWDTPQRLAWHFIPLAERKGLQVKEMTAPQRKAALALLRSALSESGYDKATTIMRLESILHELEQKRGGGPIRDAERYYFTLFGRPAGEGKWGLSVEGHHLSLNFVVADGKIASSTPAFFGANPAQVMGDYGAGPRKGTRVLAQEELLAFELVNSLTAEQRTAAIIEAKAPRDIRGAGTAQPPTDAPVGLSAKHMTPPQVGTLRKLIEVYAQCMPPAVAKARLAAVDKAGMDGVHFAWAGATKPGVGHYYRVQGATFLIELINTQPDSAGNIANHIHSVWRDMQGDFGVPIQK